MAKVKTPRRAQNLAIPFSIMLFKADDRAITKIARDVGLTKSYLMRKAIRFALEHKAFEAMVAS